MNLISGMDHKKNEEEKSKGNQNFVLDIESIEKVLKLFWVLFERN